jgi:tetratricopeptide (TPR) repeat protein
MNETTQPHKITNGGSSRPARRGFWIGLLILMLLIVLGALCGGGTGILARKQAEANQVAQSLGEQFTLSQEDVAAGRYDIARQRLEYILGEDPDYPGAQAMLADVIVKQQITPTPSDTPTPTITPTPDLTQADALFAQVEEHLAASNWDAALATLDELRVAAPTYKAAVVDGMYYISFRNRGVDKMLKQNNLEGGIKDLGLAERFGPLDGLASGYRTFAETYIRGASFWDTDWEQAVYYFGQVAPYLPYLSDSSGFTAQERYRLALIGWGTSLYDQQKWCQAQDILTEALELGDDAEARHLRNDARDKCHPPKTAGPTDTPTLEGGVTPPPTEPPTETPPGPPPSDTPPPPNP